MDVTLFDLATTRKIPASQRLPAGRTTENMAAVASGGHLVLEAPLLVQHLLLLRVQLLQLLRVVLLQLEPLLLLRQILGGAAARSRRRQR